MNGNNKTGIEIDSKRDAKHADEPETVLSIIKDFCGYTTSGGLGRVVGSKYVLFKVLWAVAFLGAFVAGIIQLRTLFQTYQSKPIGTRISLQHSVTLSFPSVTFCNFNMIRKSQMGELSGALKGEFEKYTKKKNITGKQADKPSVTMLDADDEGLADPDELDGVYKAEEKISVLLAEEDWKTLQPLGHQFETMFRTCKYQGINCRDLDNNTYWSTFWHYKFGNCYVFNPLMVNGKSQKTLMSSKPGPLHGLSVELDVEQAEYVDQLTQDAGAVVEISPRGQMPFPYEEGLSLATGFSTSMGLRRVSIERVDAFENRSCVQHQTENNANLYAQRFNSSYSKTACILSCIAYNQKKTCGCMEYKFNPADKIVCDSLNITTVVCLRKILSKARKNQLNCTTECPPPCNEEVFKITSSFSSWPSVNYQNVLRDELNKEKRNHTHSGGLSNNLLKVQIFYQELNYEKIKEDISYGFSNFMADIGGQLGLWLGVSVLTGAELVELIFLIIIHLFSRKSNRRPKINESSMEEGKLAGNGKIYDGFEMK